MGCPDCSNNDWVIMGGGDGLLQGFSRWRCTCGYVGVAENWHLQEQLANKKLEEKQARIKRQNDLRAKYTKPRYKNTFAKKFNRRFN